MQPLTQGQKGSRYFKTSCPLVRWLKRVRPVPQKTAKGPPEGPGMKKETAPAPSASGAIQRVSLCLWPGAASVLTSSICLIQSLSLDSSCLMDTQFDRHGISEQQRFHIKKETESVLGHCC